LRSFRPGRQAGAGVYHQIPDLLVSLTRFVIVLMLE
jgi:hypothetical protein